MDKDDLIRQLDRTLRIRAMFAFERRKNTPQQLEREFAQLALDMIRRQPAMADGAGMPPELLAADSMHEV